MPKTVPEKAWQQIMVDFIAIIEKTSAKVIIELFRDNVQRLHRLSESIILDRGP